jgi:hypothetical protein
MHMVPTSERGATFVGRVGLKNFDCNTKTENWAGGRLEARRLGYGGERICVPTLFPGWETRPCATLFIRDQGLQLLIDHSSGCWNKSIAHTDDVDQILAAIVPNDD